MAYITSEQVAQKRAAIKAAFPGWKFSITRENYSSIRVAILQADLKLTDKDYEQVNTYWLKDHYRNQHAILESLEKIVSICDEGNHNNSDSMTDYHDVGWYIWLTIGEWDKPFKFLEKVEVVS
jgi:hypothetical protein